MFGFRMLLVTYLIVIAPPISSQDTGRTDVTARSRAAEQTDTHCILDFDSACPCTASISGLPALALITRSALSDSRRICVGSFAALFALTHVAALPASPVATAICLALQLGEDPALVPAVPVPAELCPAIVLTLPEYAGSAWVLSTAAPPDAAIPTSRTPTLTLRSDHDTLALHRTDSQARTL